MNPLSWLAFAALVAAAVAVHLAVRLIRAGIDLFDGIEQ